MVHTRSDLGRLDGDTAISHHTFTAALKAAGAACAAVDAVMSGTARNAFCAVRPPGHHAGAAVSELLFCLMAYSHLIVFAKLADLLELNFHNAFCAVRQPGHHAGGAGFALSSLRFFVIRCVWCSNAGRIGDSAWRGSGSIASTVKAPFIHYSADSAPYGLAPYTQARVAW